MSYHAFWVGAAPVVSSLLVLKAPNAVDDFIWRLTPIEPSWHLPMLFLSFVAPPRRLALARGGTAASSDLLVVCGWIVR